MEIILSVVSPLCLIVIVFGCLSCLFKKKGFNNFKERDQRNAHRNQAYAVDPADGAGTLEQITIEPLPDILSKLATSTCFPPRIMRTHDTATAFHAVERSFPRSHLTYLNELGSGWFGQVIETEAANIIEGEKKTKVMVKMLKIDAQKQEQKIFMDQVAAYRDLDHAHVLRFLAQCTETTPHLVILEYAALGNLKNYFLNQREEQENKISSNTLLQFALNAAAGVACLHRHNYIHNDLAARNCLVMSNRLLKIGDYGISDVAFKEDYYNTGRELLPIRWMGPETLIKAAEIWTSNHLDMSSDIWSFGVLLWEIFTMGERPYSMLDDEAVLEGIVHKKILPAQGDIKVPFVEEIWLVMNQCWQEDRPDIEVIHHSLQQLSQESISDFDQRWHNLAEKNTELGSRTSLAGSFEQVVVSAPVVPSGEGLGDYVTGSGPSRNPELGLLDRGEPVEPMKTVFSVDNEIEKHKNERNNNNNSTASLTLVDVHVSKVDRSPNTALVSENMSSRVVDGSLFPVAAPHANRSLPVEDTQFSGVDPALPTGDTLLPSVDSSLIIVDTLPPNSSLPIINGSLPNTDQPSLPTVDISFPTVDPSLPLVDTTPESSSLDFAQFQSAMTKQESSGESSGEFSDFVMCLNKGKVPTQELDDFAEFVSSETPTLATAPKPEDADFSENSVQALLETSSDFIFSETSAEVTVPNLAELNISTNATLADLDVTESFSFVPASSETNSAASEPNIEKATVLNSASEPLESFNELMNAFVGLEENKPAEPLEDSQLEDLKVDNELNGNRAGIEQIEASEQVTLTRVSEHHDHTSELPTE
ncbi:receptor tyrosine-protein kinase erbB-2-like isoform X2 [Physella acuta]|uniref:receptor tyrosine-protein kinase erbB-2-like isoform X2 n=1 Tax=Physella acuta TaxID=109671 RepID=UPI0027DCDAD3|nr:receptor tyrosine-protein kinase erbB-2-like isoform X2 [Physella acuta]